MIVLVTGATGFIGSHLCRALLAQGHKVRAFHRPESPGLALEGLVVEHHLGDITQPATLNPALENVEVVFHAAAHLGRRDSSQRYSTTVEGTRNVLQAARHAGVRRLVHTSSVAALGVPIEQNQHGFIPGVAMDENHVWNYPAGWWPYGHAKYLAELEVQKAVAQGMDAVIVNPALVIGAGDLNRISGAVLIQVARGRLPISVPGGLNAVHIMDVIRGHLAAMEHGRIGERYILGNENMTHTQFIKLAADISRVKPPRLTPSVGLCHALVRPVAFLSKFFRLPLRPTALRQAGYYFYYKNDKAIMQLGLDNYLPVKQAMVEAIDWYRQRNYL
jgi:dihydroflavonol-4-reductase